LHLEQEDFDVGKRSILIADDDIDLVNILTTRCRALGLEVDSAYNAMTALGKIEENQPDLVILDVNMPAGNGLGVCEMMANHEQLSSIPVIMLTGHCDQETIRRCRSLQAHYVAKSHDIWSRVERLLRSFLDIPRADDCRSSAATPADCRLLSELAEPDDAHHSISASEPSPFAARGSVLCIDDNSDFSCTLRLRLEQLGIEVLGDFAVMDSYRYAQFSRAGVIVLFYDLPEFSGDYVLRRLKENPVTQDIPVIVLAAREEPALQRKMYDLGAARFFTKSVDWETLWDELQLHMMPWQAPANCRSLSPILKLTSLG
jgi:CheY-like chemotaxis protein